MTTFDLIIQNGTILTMDPENRVIENGSLCVLGDTISHLGDQPPESHDALKTIDAKGGLILPGLINGHTHAAMSLFKGLADDLPLMEWLDRYIFPVEKNMDADFIHTGTQLACAEMILSGTTCFCDMYLFEDQVAQAAFESGLRCLVGEVLYDFPSPNYGDLENGFAYTQWLIEKWKDNPLVSIAVEPHALFTCSPELLQRANEMALSHGRPLIIHFAETQAELEEIETRYGKRPLGHLEALGIVGPHLIADHAVHVNSSEIDKMAEYGIKVVHNPESNMKLEFRHCTGAPDDRSRDNSGHRDRRLRFQQQHGSLHGDGHGGQAPQGSDHGPHGYGCAHRTENGDHRRGQSVGALP